MTTPEVIEDFYRNWRGFDPPMRDDEVKHRIQRSIAAGTEDDFSVVKNLHVRIKNGRATFYIKFTPKPPNSTITAKSNRPIRMTLGPFTEEAVKPAIDQWLAENDDFVAKNVEIVKKGRARYSVKLTLVRKPPTTGSESKARAERPIKLTLGEYADRHRDGSGVTYWAALSIVEEWRDCMENAREHMPGLDEREMFDLWRRGLQGRGHSEQQFLRMLEQIFRSKRLQQPVIEHDTSDDDDEVIASRHSREYLVDRNTEAKRDYDIVDERGKNTNR